MVNWSNFLRPVANIAKYRAVLPTSAAKNGKNDLIKILRSTQSLRNS